MSGWWRRGTSGQMRAWGLAMLVVGMLTACAGPGGEGLATIGAAATVNDRLTTPGGTASATASAAAATGTTAGRTVGAAVSSAGTGSVASVASATAARSPVAAGSVTAGSAPSGTRPATGGSATPGAAGSATRPTTGSATTGGATARPGTTTASTASMAVIPPPPNGMEYMQGSNMVIDTILMAAEQGLNSSSDSVAVTSTKDYVSTSTAVDVGAFYRMQMPMLGWKSEQDQNSASGITTLVFSRDNQTNAALILIVDLTQVNQKGCLVITATAKPK